jgi:uncharacterized OB-fold protein
MKAKIYTYSIVYVPSTEFKEQAPFIVTVLEDQEGNRFPAQIAGYDETLKVNIGDEVDFLGDNKWHLV